MGRRNWTFADSDAGGHRTAAVYTLIETCKMNHVAIRKPGSRTCWPGFQITPLTKSTNCFPGIGSRTNAQRPPLLLSASLADIAPGVLAGCVRSNTSRKVSPTGSFLKGST